MGFEGFGRFRVCGSVGLWWVWLDWGGGVGLARRSGCKNDGGGREGGLGEMEE